MDKSDLLIRSPVRATTGIAEQKADAIDEADPDTVGRQTTSGIGRLSACTAYHHHMGFERITIDPAKMRGAPCVRGLRIPVATVIGQLAAGRSTDEILADFPDLEAADITAALEYAAEAVQERELPLTRRA